MSADYQNILEIFDLAGPAKPQEEDAPPKEGKNAAQSQQLGQVSMTKGDYATAIEHFRRAIEQGGTDIAGDYFNLAAAYATADMAPQALRQYERARKIKDSGELHVGLGELYRRYGRLKDAVAELEEAIRLEPGNAFFHFKLAESLRGSGFRTQALQAISGAVASAPDDAFYHYWMGDLLLEMKRPQDAVPALHAAIELSPGDDHLFMLASVALWGSGKRAEAIRSIRLAADLDAEKLLYYELLSRYLEAEGHLAEAAVEKEKAAQIDRYDSEVADAMWKLAQIVPIEENNSAAASSKM